MNWGGFTFLMSALLSGDPRPPERRTQWCRWKHLYNTVGLPQALSYLTPLEFLERYKFQQKKAERH